MPDTTRSGRGCMIIRIATRTTDAGVAVSPIARMPVRQRQVLAVDRIARDQAMAALLCCSAGAMIDHRADGLQDLRDRGDAGRLDAVVVGDQDAIGRRIGPLPGCGAGYEDRPEQDAGTR